MIVLIGVGVVFLSVFGGFLLAGGPLMLLIQPAEILIIIGAALGTVLIGTPHHHLPKLFAGIRAVVGRATSGKDQYTDLLTLQFEVFVNIKKHGIIALDQDIAAPESSTIFSKYPSFLAFPKAVRFFADALRLLLDTGIPPEDLDLLLDRELETHHEEVTKASGILAKLGDTLPGLGIVAAIVGIVISMQGVDGPASEMGRSVAAALVGTFLGVFLSYGVVQPLAMNLDFQSQAEAKYLECIKSGVVAMAKGTPPAVAVEFARRVIFSHERPELDEMDTAIQVVSPR
ncbi:MAG: flagellar motor stator protein MotA [Candidatus Rokubacteria bacterium]|nr:flagellar motor stator protein MotA [Candidatus Rokubacteria bacterium]